MKASTLLSKLIQAIGQHGDVDVYVVRQYADLEEPKDVQIEDKRYQDVYVVIDV